MPHVIALALAGAGLYAGYRWLSREYRRALLAAEKAQEDLSTRAAARDPKDLGALEWDGELGVYRPSRRA